MSARINRSSLRRMRMGWWLWGRVSRAVQAAGRARAAAHSHERAPRDVWEEKSLVCLKTSQREARLESNADDVAGHSRSSVTTDEHAPSAFHVERAPRVQASTLPIS